MIERQTRDRMVAGSSPGRSGGRMFYPGSAFHAGSHFGIRSIPELPQWHVRGLGLSAKTVRVAGYS